MFSSPKPSCLKCEGYWGKGYQPQPEMLIWWEKPNWLRKAYAVERYLIDTGQFKIFRGIASSRLIHNEFLGNCEFFDRELNMCWPEFYVKHYIETHNVMPTEEFYNYIMKKYDTLPTQYR